MKRRFSDLHPEDFGEHARLCDQLLGHYHHTFLDRRVYYVARTRAQTHGDILVAICDGFDRAKLCLPKWPLKRTPKRPVFEKYMRCLVSIRILWGFGEDRIIFMYFSLLLGVTRY